MSASVLLWVILTATVGGVVAFGVWRDTRSRRRLALGQCVRCGTAVLQPVDLSAVDLNPTVPLLMCESCARRTRRNHLRAYRVAVAIGLTGVAALILGVSRDMRRGAHYSLRDYWWLLSVIALPAAWLVLTFRRGLGKHD